MTSLDSPQWVAAELERRGITVLVTGDTYSTTSSDPVEAVTALNVERWARLGGGRPGDIITADLVNRGRLVDVMQREEART